MRPAPTPSAKQNQRGWMLTINFSTVNFSDNTTTVVIQTLRGRKDLFESHDFSNYKILGFWEFYKNGGGGEKKMTFDIW